MRYVPLASLELRHAYHADGRCPDFEVRVSASGQRVIDRHRLIVRARADGLVLLTPVDGEGRPPVDLRADAPIGLELRLRNPDFARFSDLSAYAGVVAPRLTNADAGDGGELTIEESVAGGREALAVQAGAGAESFALAGQPRQGVTLADFAIDGEAPLSVLAYDPALRTITVECGAAAPAQRFTIAYPIAPALPRGVFATVELRGEGAAWLAEAPAEFTITFAPRATLWTYYVITDVDPGDFSIVDAGAVAPAIAFSVANRRDLDADPDPGDPAAAALAARYPGKRRIRFDSDAAVVCSAEPRRGLELRVDGERLPFALAEPPITNLTIRDVVVDEANQRQESRFRVVTHLTTPLQANG